MRYYFVASFSTLFSYLFTWTNFQDGNCMRTRTTDAQWNFRQTIWADWVFSTNLSAPILVQWVPCPCFSLFNHYIHFISTSPIFTYLGLGFEFGPQRIRDLAFWLSVVRDLWYPRTCQFEKNSQNHCIWNVFLQQSFSIHLLPSILDYRAMTF